MGVEESELLLFRLSGKEVERRVMVILAVSSPPLHCFFGLFSMPAGFSEEVGGEGGGSRRERRRSTSC